MRRCSCAVAVTVGVAVSRAAAAECLRNGKRYLSTSVQGELSSCSVCFCFCLLAIIFGLDCFCRVLLHPKIKGPRNILETRERERIFSLLVVGSRQLRVVCFLVKQIKFKGRKQANTIIINVFKQPSCSPSTANQPTIQ